MRIVIKIGTSTLAHPTGHLNIRRVEQLCKIMSDIKNAGHELILVSSGAIGMGVGKLGLRERPKDIPSKQAAAAVGQCELMYTYDKLFSEYHHTVAQLLITGDDTTNDTRRFNFTNTLNRLLELGALPVINENDTVATDEIVIGDNDTLAAIVDALRSGLRSVGITENAVNLVQDTSRESAAALMTANGYIDLLIPRGGAGLINACVSTATVPCIATGTGICHVYVEKSADLNMALNIVENAKTSRPSVCNAEEVLLVDKAIAPTFLPMLYKRLVTDRERAVELRLDETAAAIIPGKKAGEKDFDTEFLDYILAVKCVEDVKEAVAHIAAHSTGHSEAIVTRSPEAERYFTANVDSAAVYVNASTRFTDGGEFGLGCEMGISTQKLHARGPMGLQELTTYKYIIHGNGHIR